MNQSEILDQEKIRWRAELSDIYGTVLINPIKISNDVITVGDPDYKDPMRSYDVELDEDEKKEVFSASDNLTDEMFYKTYIQRSTTVTEDINTQEFSTEYFETFLEACSWGEEYMSELEKSELKYIDGKIQALLLLGIDLSNIDLENGTLKTDKGDIDEYLDNVVSGILLSNEAYRSNYILGLLKEDEGLVV